ncbi:MAG: restriction endonuclease subunit S [Nitrospira sp.]
MTMESMLPSSWVKCNLGEVIDYGVTYKAEPEEIPANAWVLELEDIEKDTSKVLQRVKFAQRQSKSTKNQFSAGDVLYGKLRPYLNKVIRADEDGYCTTEIIPLKPSDVIKGGYLFYWLKHPTFLEYVTRVSHGLHMPRLGTEAGRNAPFVLAPTNEQKRIADKLDAVLARVDACREHLDRVPMILKKFRQAVLEAAISGALTEEWHEDNPRKADATKLAEEIQGAHVAAGGHKRGNAAPPTEDVHDLTPDMFPRGWALLTLRDLVLPDRPITYGILKPGPEQVGGVPYIRVADFPSDKLNVASIRRTSKRIDEEFKRSRLRSGDLLLSIRGTVGRVVVIPDELQNANITQDSARLSIQPSINRDYVLWYLRSGLAQSRMKGSTKGVAVRGINIGDVRAIQVPLPSRDEQDEIVRRVEALFQYAERLERRYVAAREQVERLTPAILAKAFRGELVPQDPNDEPASSLLERIRSAKAKLPTQEQRRKPLLKAAKRKSKEKSLMAKSRFDNDVMGKPYLTGLLRQIGGSAKVADLFQKADLPVVDFYKQLAWEVEKGHVLDKHTSLKVA